MSDAGLPVLVINLEGSEDRWSHASGQMESLGVAYERVEAVNGNALSDDEFEQLVDRPSDRFWRFNLQRPELGCYLSHVKAWTRIAESYDMGACVAEDDFVAGPGLKEVLEKLACMDFGPKPVIVKFYANRVSKRLGSVPLDGEHRLVAASDIDWGTVFYYMNRPAAAAMLGSRSRYLRPVDEDIRCDWETGITVLKVVPFPVSHREFGSFLEDARQQSNRFYQRAYIKFRRRIHFEVRNRMHVPVRWFRARRVFAQLRSSGAFDA